MANQLDYLGLDPKMITPSGFKKVGMSHMFYWELGAFETPGRLEV